MQKINLQKLLTIGDTVSMIKNTMEWVMLILIGLCFMGCGYYIYRQNNIIAELRIINNKNEFKILEQDFDIKQLTSRFDKGIELQKNEYYPPVDYPIITSGLGLRISPITGFEAVHYGTDVYSNLTMNVYAVQDGIVINHWPAPDGYHKGHEIYRGS